MMSLTLGLFTQVSDSGPQGPHVQYVIEFCLVLLVTLFRPDIHFGVLCKQCRPSSDAAECSISLGSTLFAYRNFYAKYSKKENMHEKPLKMKCIIHPNDKDGQVYWAKRVNVKLDGSHTVDSPYLDFGYIE